MKRLANALLSLTVVFLLAVAGLAVAQKTGFLKNINSAYTDFASRISSLPSVGQVESTVTGAVSSLQSAVRQAQSAGNQTAAKAVKKGAETPHKTTKEKVKLNVVNAVPSSSSASQNQIVDRSSFHYSGIGFYEYGRSQLNGKEQACYDKIRQAVDDCYDGYVDMPYRLGTNDLSKVMSYYLSDHPEVFYIRKTVTSYSSAGIGTQLGINFYCSDQGVGMISVEYTDPPSVISARKKQLQNEVGYILSKIDRSMTQEQKLEAIYEEAMSLWRYNDAAVTDPKDHLDSFESYGALVDRSAVCAGYAKALKILLDTAGIQSLVVTGEADNGTGVWGGHAWNAVCAGGSWRYVDATFDDTGKTTKYMKESISDFLKDHRTDACTDKTNYANYLSMPLPVN